MTDKTYTFDAEVGELLHLLTHSIYSNKEIFIRELVSNSSDAIDKARIKSITDTNYLGDDSEFKILIDIDKEKKTITIKDNGVGMTEAEVKKNIGTIAKSGTREFIEGLKKNKENTENSLIGQFGVGFYSVFMIAKKVELETKSNEGKAAIKWISEGKGKYEIASSEKKTRGTEITIFLNKDEEDFLDEFRVKSLIKKYSNYVPVPIQMLEMADEKDKNKIRNYETINETKSIWTKSKSEIKDEEYKEFYKNISFDYGNDPLDWIHINIEGAVSFKALLYIPEKKGFDMMQPEQDYGPKLYVQNVMILEQSKDLLPQWLRFVKGVVETNDLPLNISRELLQNNAVMNKIKTSLVKKILDKLSKVNEDFPGRYSDFMDNFGSVFKEGIHFEQQPKDKEKVAALIKFESLNKGKKITLDEYIADRKKDQKEIFYITGSSLEDVKQSPYLEVFREQKIDVLLLTDAIDEWVVNSLPEYKESKLKSITTGELELDGDNEEKKEEKEKKQKDFKDFLPFVKNILGGEKVEEVRLSSRLKDSVGVLVTKEGEMSAHMEKMMQAMHQHNSKSKRILELNSNHELVKGMLKEYKKDIKSETLQDLIMYTYEQALLNEGSKIEDMKGFVQRLNKFAKKYLG